MKRWRSLAALALASLGLFLGPMPGRQAQAAQEVEIRALQDGLTKLGLFTGAVDGETSAGLDAAIAAYLRHSGYRGPPDRAFRTFGALVNDVDLELRIRAGKARVAERQLFSTRFGQLAITTYVQDGAPRGFSGGRRVMIGAEPVDAGLASFVGCCDVKVFPVGEADIVVLQGTLDQPSCPVTRVYVSLTRERFTVTDGEDSCATEPQFTVDQGRLLVRAQSRTSLVDARFTLEPGEPIRFERLMVPGPLEPLSWWVGKPPQLRNEAGFRFFHFAPLADALAALLEPEALGWTLKMGGTPPVETRDGLIFVSGSYRTDETLVSVTIDPARRAVHACSFSRGMTRFSSTLIRGVFVDPAASCPDDIEHAIATWAAFGVIDGAPQRVFGFEGAFGDAAQCRAGGDRVTRITTRAVTLAGEAECPITEVGIADGDYAVATICRTFPIKRLDDDRIDLDGDVLKRCPE